MAEPERGWASHVPCPSASSSMHVCYKSAATSAAVHRKIITFFLMTETGGGRTHLCVPLLRGGRLWRGAAPALLNFLHWSSSSVISAHEYLKTFLCHFVLAQTTSKWSVFADIFTSSHR